MEIAIPSQLATSCRRVGKRNEWLRSLPNAVNALKRQWQLDLGAPFESASCAWVAPAQQNGRSAVLKVGMPHMEAAHELQGLQFWNGDPTVKVLQADGQWNAMLLEACEPGVSLHLLPEEDQDPIVAELLHRCWRQPTGSHPFRPLSTQLTHWSEETERQSSRWGNTGLVREGLQLFRELSIPSRDDVLLATDLHAGNILRAQRKPWLVIDPKPFIGDPAYDATQHLLNCQSRLRHKSSAVIDRFSDLLCIDNRRLKSWLFARLAAEPRDVWDDEAFVLARRVLK